MTLLQNPSWEIFVVLIAIGLIVYLNVSCQVYVILPWMKETWEDLATLWIFIIFIGNLLTILSLWSFLMASLTDPGGIPFNYKSFIVLKVIPAEVRNAPCSSLDDSLVWTSKSRGLEVV